MVYIDLNLYFVVFISIYIKLSNSQVIQPNFRSSDVELTPSLMIMNSTSTVNFFCTNYHPENLPLVISLSRNISRRLLKLSTYQVNETTTRITIQSRRFIGIFYLFCYIKDNEQRGTRADVIIKADAGLLRLARRCQVYYRKYIKCALRASTLARAIQNGFSPEIEFTENTKLPSYKEYEFLKNDSTNDYLVFKWEPTVDGQFPNDVKMNIKITLPFFGTSQHRFDMTPIFVINPNFTVRAISRNKVGIQLVPNSPPAICQLNIQLKSNSTKNRTWTTIESDRTDHDIDKPLLDTLYQICVRCRQTSNDSYSPEECQEIILSPRPNKWKNIIIPILIIISLILLILIPIRIYIWCSKKKPTEPSKPLPPVLETLIHNKNAESYSDLPNGTSKVIFDFESSVITESESPLTPDKYEPVFLSKYT